MAEVKPPFRVIRRKDILTYPKVGEEAYSVAVTYIAGDLPPHTLFIPKPEWSADKERELILKDIERRKAERV